MPAVFVHSVPDTERVWSGVIARLRRNDVVALSLPGFGHEAPSGFDATKEAYLVATGVPAADAEETARHVDATMKRCILALYRSAVHVGREWSDDLRRITAPGLVLWGELDPYAASRFGARLAERTNARFVCRPGCSHWWQLERPDVVAGELQRFWKELSSLPARAG